MMGSTASVLGSIFVAALGYMRSMIGFVKIIDWNKASQRRYYGKTPSD